MSKPRKLPKAPRNGTDQDWSEILKGATPEAVAKALLQPREPLKPRPDNGVLKDRM